MSVPARWRAILIAFLGTRAGLLVVGLVSMVTLPRGQAIADVVPGAPWLSMWVRWDSNFYSEIAVDGYSFDPDQQSNVSFFPLYPLLIRMGLALTGRSDDAAAALVGLLISNAALLVALAYLLRLVTDDFGLAAGRRAVLYVLVFPTTLFLSAVYPESLFLATSVASFYHARRGEWYRAGLAGGLAALTRPFGVLLVVPLAIEMIRRRPAWRAIPALALIPAGTALFFGYLWWRFGDPLLYIRGNASWGRGFAPPWETFLEYLRGPLILYGFPRSVVDLAFALGLAVLAIAAWRRLPASYAAFATAGLLFTISSGSWLSMPRHALALFPLIVLLAVWGERRIFNAAYLAIAVALAALFMFRFASWFWVA